MVTRTRNSTTESNKTTAAKAAGTAARPARHGRAAVKDITPVDRQQLIAEAAYYIAERRGFSPGNELEDWLQAEQEVDLLKDVSMH
jgi:hypothetical protein